LENKKAIGVDRMRQIMKMDIPELSQLETSEKALYLKIKIDQETPPVHQGANSISVNREFLISDSMAKFKPITNLRKELKINFVEEVSQDAGGISREFFTAIFKEIQDPCLGLFSVAGTEEFSYKIDEFSNECVGWQDLFYFFGRLMAKSCFDRIAVNLCLNRSVFNALLNKNSAQFYDNLEELKFVDTNVYTSLKFFRDSDLT
jgi:E3 ubiquitin-protein ligase HUWE1